MLRLKLVVELLLWRKIAVLCSEGGIDLMLGGSWGSHLPLALEMYFCVPSRMALGAAAEQLAGGSGGMARGCGHAGRAVRVQTE